MLPLLAEGGQLLPSQFSWLSCKQTIFIQAGWLTFCVALVLFMKVLFVMFSCLCFLFSFFICSWEHGLLMGRQAIINETKYCTSFYLFIQYIPLSVQAFLFLVQGGIFFFFPFYPVLTLSCKAFMLGPIFFFSFLKMFLSLK